MSGVGSLPLDENYHPVLGLKDDVSGNIYPVHIGSLVTGSDGKTYAILDVQATVSTTGLATSAKQDTGNTSLASVKTDLDSLVTNTADLLADGDNLATIAANTGNIPAKGAAATSASTPVNIASDQSSFPVEQWIPNMIRAGKGYLASYMPSGAQPVTSTNGSLTVCPLSLFNPSNSGKSILIYSILVGLNETKSLGSQVLRLTTTDPGGGAGFTAQVTPTNLKAGGAASGASVYATVTGATASSTFAGTVIALNGSTTGVYNEYLTNGAVILLPAGAANGISLSTFVTTAGDNYLSIVKYIEF